MGKKFYGLTGTKLNVAIAIIAGTDFALFGYDQASDTQVTQSAIPHDANKLLQGVMGGLLTLPSFLAHFPQIDTQHPMDGMTASQASNIQGITVGGYTLGCFFGAVATIWLGNWLGRKKTIFIGSTIMIIGAALQCSSFQLGQLIAARLITGFGNGRMRIVSHRLAPLQRLTLCRHEHIDCTYLAIRDLKIASPRPDGDDRRLAHRLRCDAFLLDRSWLFVLGTLDHLLALPNRLPDHPCHLHRLLDPRPAGIATLADTEGPRA